MFFFNANLVLMTYSILESKWKRERDAVIVLLFYLDQKRLLFHV